jgi:hypothetical protein
MENTGLILTEKVHSGAGYAQYREVIIQSTMAKTAVLFFLWLAWLVCWVTFIHVYGNTSDNTSDIVVTTIAFVGAVLLMIVGILVASYQCDNTQVITAAPVGDHPSVINAGFQSFKNTPGILAMGTLMIISEIGVLIYSDYSPLLIVVTVVTIGIIAATMVSVLLLFNHNLLPQDPHTDPV